MPRPMKTFSVGDADKRTVLTQAGWVRQGPVTTGPFEPDAPRRPERWLAPAAGSAPVSLRTAWTIHQGRAR